MTAKLVRIRLEPLAITFEVARDARLLSALAAHGIEFPCGGEGVCGGCRIRVLAGSLPITSADRAHFFPQQLEDGWRLACHACAIDPVVLECGQWQMDVLSDASHPAPAGKRGLGIA